MKHSRPAWVVVSTACAVVVVASVVGSVATGMGWWKWSWAQTSPTGVRGVSIARGGVHYHEASWLPRPGSIPITGSFFGNFFTIHVESPGWWFKGSMQTKTKEVVVPMWAMGLAACSVGVLAWRRARWVRPGHCAKCSYDLTGLAAGAVCPECGANAASGGAGVPPALAPRES